MVEIIFLRCWPDSVEAQQVAQSGRIGAVNPGTLFRGAFHVHVFLLRSRVTHCRPILLVLRSAGGL
jgi:hypothetical protein